MNDKHLNDLIFMAFRYAMGRRTYIVEDFSEIIKANIKLVNTANLSIMKREISIALDEDNAGMRCDKDIWTQLLTLIKEQL